MASSPKDPKQQKTKPIRRNDVIHCENCGEDYPSHISGARSATSGRPKTGAPEQRVAAEWPAEAGAAGRPTPFRWQRWWAPLVLIIVAMYIVFTSLAPPVQQGRG